MPYASVGPAPIPAGGSYRPCRVCYSPYRYQIEQAWRNKPLRDLTKTHRMAIVKKYTTELGLKSERTALRLLQLHHQSSHFKAAQKFPYLEHPKGSPQPDVSKTTLNELSQSLLDIGKQMADFYQKNPELAVQNLSFRDIFAAQDTITKRMMVDVQKDAVKVSMAKLFSGQMLPKFKIEEGKVIDEDDSKSLIRLLSENSE